MNKVIFNKSKIGWFKINTNGLIRHFNYLGVTCCAIDELKFISQYESKKTNSVDLNENYLGVSLYEVCIYNICNDLIIFQDELRLDLHREVIEKWFSIAKTIIDDLNEKFNDNNFSLVLIINGHSLLDACLLAFAKKISLPFLSIEATSKDNRIVWDNVSGKVITYNLAKKYFSYYRYKINEERYETYVTHFKNTIFDNKRKDHLSNENNSEIPFDKPYVLFLGQVYSDAAQLFALNGDFDNPVKVIENTIQICCDLKLPLVIKLHPKEYKGIGPVFARPYALPTYKRIKHNDYGDVHIDYQNEYNTFKLIHNAQLIVTVNSQAGLEACLYDKPVLNFFRSFYSGLGFTYDYKDKKTLKTQMNFLIKNKVYNNRNLDEAQKFFYIFFEKYCIENSATGLLFKAVQAGSFNKRVKIKLLLFKAINLLKK